MTDTLSKDSSVPERTPAQIMRMTAVYDLLARALPTEGRDYSVKFNFGSDDNPSFFVSFEHHTPIGKIWCDYCKDILKKARTK